MSIRALAGLVATVCAMAACSGGAAPAATPTNTASPSGDGTIPSATPLCNGASAGEKRSGFRVANSVTYAVDSPDQLAEVLGLGPNAAPSTWSLRAIGCPPEPARTVCASRGLVVASQQGIRGPQYY